MAFNIEQINSSTFKISYNKWAEVEIGNKDAVNFEPHAKLKGYANCGVYDHYKLRGRKRSKETVRKIVEGRKGYRHSEATKKKIGIAGKGKLGPYIPLKSRIKMSIERKGDKGSNWKGGIEPENKRIRKSIEYRLWREAVFARDNWTCQKCKERGGIKLHPHHIKGFAQYPELRFAIDNGITFCIDCHKEFHQRYGNKNTLEQIKEFLRI